jgi:hypothetical protein
MPLANDTFSLAKSQRHVTSFGVKNLRTLRTFKGVKNIRQLRVMYPGKSDEDIYFTVATEYNNLIDSQKQSRESKQRTRESDFLADMVELPIAPTTKQSREQRLRNNMMSRVLRQHTTTIKDKQRFDRKALNGVFEDVVYEMDYEQYFYNIEDIVFDTVMQRYSRQSLERNLLVGLLIEFEMETEDADMGVITYQLYYNSERVIRVLSPTQIREWAGLEMQRFSKRLTEIGTRSNLVFSGVTKLHIQFSEKRKVRGGSYIELPKAIQLKHACVNIKNNEQECLKWSLLAYKYYDKLTRKDKNMVSCYKPYENDIIIPDGVSFPVSLGDIPKIEKANNLKINVFRLEGLKLQTVYNTMERNPNVVNLLLLENNGNNHYVWIRDLARLLCESKKKAKSYACPQCLNATYDTDEKLQKHLHLCMQHDAVRVVMPEEGKNILTFTNHGRSFKHPFAVFLDFESTLLPCVTKEQGDSQVEKYQQHQINSVGFKYNCIHNSYSEPIQIINNSDPEKIVEHLICELERLAKKSYQLTKQHINHNLTTEQKKRHFANKQCEYCSCSYDTDNKRVVHHDHITGEYLATICNRCNLQHTYERFLPVYIHNLKGYDSHFIVPYLMKYGSVAKDVTCIPNNEERYISFSKKIKVGEYLDKNGVSHDATYEIRFLDTLAFMATSLDSLASNLRDSCNSVEQLRHTFKNVSQHFTNDDEFKLMIQKGVYPYDYIDKYERLNETKLPPKHKFYSKLTDSHISTKEYLRAKLVWNKFQCNKLLDYHNLYLSSDVLLLADIWENFKYVCYRIYNLDASYYYTAPSLSWDAFLKHQQNECRKENKNFEIELLTDIDMMTMVESGIRGGLSQISKRYAKANHKGMNTYDKNLYDAYILYLDANNLYGYAMSQYLPQSGFCWNNQQWTAEDIMRLGDKDPVGYLFDVDLHYPEELHDHHNGYALAPESMSVMNHMLNEWQQEDRKESKCNKLITSFYDKKNYVVNYRLLKLYLQLGLKLTKVNRVLQYNQSDYMASYIMKNTEERKRAKNDFEKDFYKLMNNSVYGKTMENVRNRINFSLVCSEDKALNFHNTMKKRTIFNETCVGVHLLKKEVKLCKPVFIGQCVLDDSKHLMYDFHYNFMLKNFDRNNIDLLFTDTDSLCYEIRKQNPYAVIGKNKEKFDLASYPKDHTLYDTTNDKAIGKFKDEAVKKKMDYITEFVGLRSKMYSYTTALDNAEHHKCKGVKKYVVEKQFKTQFYKDCLHSRKSQEVQQNGFRSYQHQLYTEKVNKIGLSCRDDKSYIQDDNINTYTLGHYKIRK